MPKRAAVVKEPNTATHFLHKDRKCIAICKPERRLHQGYIPRVIHGGAVQADDRRKLIADHGSPHQVEQIGVGQRWIKSYVGGRLKVGQRRIVVPSAPSCIAYVCQVADMLMRPLVAVCWQLWPRSDAQLIQALRLCETSRSEIWQSSPITAQMGLDAEGLAFNLHEPGRIGFVERAVSPKHQRDDALDDEWKCKTGLNAPCLPACGGSGEIRTHGRVAPSAVFKTAALNRSATLPLKARSLTVSMHAAGRESAFILMSVQDERNYGMLCVV